MDFDFSNIASAIPVKSAPEVQITVADPAPEVKEVQEETQTVLPDSDTALKKLYDLMGAHNVTRQQMQEIVADKGYFPCRYPRRELSTRFYRGRPYSCVGSGTYGDIKQRDTILRKEYKKMTQNRNLPEGFVPSNDGSFEDKELAWDSEIEKKKERNM